MGEPPTDGRTSTRDGWLIVLYGLLLVAAAALLAKGLLVAADSGDLMVLGLGVVALIIPTALYPIASAMMAAKRLKPSEATLDIVSVKLGQVLDQLRLANDRLVLSESAKQIAYREKEKEALRQAIRHDLDKRDFDGALGMVEQMISTYGARVEAEQYRAEILSARAAWVDQTISEASENLERTLSRHDWEAARLEAQKIQRQFPDSERVRVIDRRIEDARLEYKHHLTREFLEAAARDDVELAMQLLRQLDMYLTEEEAAPFREAARGVITKKRTNLGVQFKLAVHDNDWSAALRIGREIDESFPNTTMAAEVRGMKDMLRARASGT